VLGAEYIMIGVMEQERATLTLDHVLFGPLVWDEEDGMAKPRKGGGLKLRLKLRTELCQVLKNRIGAKEYQNVVDSITDGRLGQL
jgi:hypothetical protein